MKYLFIGNRMVDRPDTWMSVTHTGPVPPEEMTIVVELYAEVAHPFQRGEIGRATQARHRYYRHTISRKTVLSGETEEKYVYLHESIGGAADLGVPLEPHVAAALWADIAEREAKDRG